MKEDATSLEIINQKLRHQNQTLNKQLKLLVRTERQLHRTRGAMEQQVRRIGALSDFALDTSSVYDGRRVLGSALDILLKTFSFYEGIAVLVDDWCGVYRVIKRPREEVDLIEAPALVFAPCKGRAPVLIRPDQSVPPQSLAAVRPWIDIEGESAWHQRWGVLIPLMSQGRCVGFLWGATLSKAVSYHSILPCEGDRPFLELTRTHVEAALEHARMHVELERSAQLLEERVNQRTAELNTAKEALQSSLTHLQDAQSRIVETSRRAGMAEIATGVLHNVGNVLNSVNVSADMLEEQLSASRVEGVKKAASLMKDHGEDLGAFMTEDPRGRQLIEYLWTLGEHLSKARASSLEELSGLKRNIEHIKTIVSTQQDYARVVGVKEWCSLKEVVEDALTLSAVGQDRQDIEVVQRVGECGELLMDRHRTLQILINLLGNARHALSKAQRRDKRVMLSVKLEGSQLIVEVEDNGVGIPETRMGQIFTHGFSTRQGGHGFGLHNSALAAKEMGGELKGESGGENLGATFTLKLPAHFRMERVS